MAGMGPPPKDADRRARRNKTVPMTVLPADGRKGTPPAWPLLPDAASIARLAFLEEQATSLRDEWAAAEDGRKARALAKRLEAAEVRVAEARQVVEHLAKLERQLWTDIWKTPQAVQWERLRWTREVAQYVRLKVKAELGSLDAAKESRQLADRLGLYPLAMRRLFWTIATDEVGAKRAAKKAPAKPTGSRARRGALTLVDPPKAAGDG